MSFPEWAHSYNALYVPLRSTTWNCALIPHRDVHEATWWWSFAEEESQKKKQQFEEQLEVDRQDFFRYFRFDIDARNGHLSSEFRRYSEFIKKTLRLSYWDMPETGNGIVRILRDAVRDRQIIPAIDRGPYGLPNAIKHYAPQHWPRDDSGASFGMTTDGTNAPTGRFTGPFAAAMHVADMVMNSRLFRSSALSGKGGGGFDWLGAAESVVGAAPSDAASDESDGDSMLKCLDDTGDSADGSLGDAQPFAYRSDSLSDGVTALAARSINEADEAECFAQYEADMEMCSAGGAMYQSAAYYIECKARAFRRYQQCRGY